MPKSGHNRIHSVFFSDESVVADPRFYGGPLNEEDSFKNEGTTVVTAFLQL